MRILLAAKCPPNGPNKIGGVQSWCTTVGDELVKRGHTVTFWGPGQKVRGAVFDLGILANWAYVHPVAKLCKTHITICHGIIQAESPPANGPVVFTSEGVRDYWAGEGDVLRQPIDTDFWCPDKEAQPQYLTRLSYRNGLTFLPLLARKLHLDFRHLKNAPPQAVRETIRRSACVVATGRASLEVMACGVPVVICDHRSSYQGPLLDLNIQHAMKNNYSGRGGVVPTPGNTLEVIKEAIDNGGLRDRIKRHHNVVNVVNKLLEAV